MSISSFLASPVSGHGRGRQLTFPTMNLSVERELPVGKGVYSVRVRLLDEWVNGVMHVGPRPTFHEDDVSIEVHLLDFSGTIHPESVEVRVLGRIRDVRSFDSPEALKKQIAKDIMIARDHFKTHDSSFET